MRRQVPVAAACALAALVGCEDHSRYPGEEKSAERGIERAESAGADQHSSATLAAAKRSLEEARAAEESAGEDQEDAQKKLDAIGPRLQETKRKVATRKAQLEGEKAVRDDLVAEVDRLERHQSELTSSGLSEAEIHKSVGGQLELARKRVASENAYVSVLQQSVTLAELDQRHLDLAEQAARTKLDGAHEKYQLLARSLYERSLELSNLAEAESYEVRRQKLEATP